ncbi:hypothetical protein RI065_04120 [Mycoplasmatota bacterium zrk1]
MRFYNLLVLILITLSLASCNSDNIIEGVVSQVETDSFYMFSESSVIGNVKVTCESCNFGNLSIGSKVRFNYLEDEIDLSTYPYSLITNKIKIINKTSELSTFYGIVNFIGSNFLQVHTLNHFNTLDHYGDSNTVYYHADNGDYSNIKVGDLVKIEVSSEIDMVCLERVYEIYGVGFQEPCPIKSKSITKLHDLIIPSEVIEYFGDTNIMILGVANGGKTILYGTDYKIESRSNVKGTKTFTQLGINEDDSIIELDGCLYPEGFLEKHVFLSEGELINVHTLLSSGAIDTFYDLTLVFTPIRIINKDNNPS